MNIVYLNGQFIAKDKATISVLDRGFLFGDAVYEAFPVYHGKIFGLTEHLNRLQRSLNALEIKLSINHQQWQQLFDELMQHNPSECTQQTIYLQITRGVATTRKHAYPDNLTPTIFATINDSVTSAENYNQGFKAITLPDTRWHNCHIKSTNLLPNILASKQAERSGAKDAILIRDGYVIEAASSNVFIVQQGKILTPPISHYMLSGITRHLIIELAQAKHIPCEESLITEQALQTADEIWLSGSIKEITPIIQLNEQPVGNGQIGEITRQIQVVFADYKQRFINTEQAVI